MRTRVEVRTLPPRILQHAPGVGEVAGGQVSLLCTALGVPAPLIKFKFAGDEYTGRPANDASALNTTTAVLDIRNLGLGNEGEYSCLAVNEYGHDQASTQLHVYARTQILKGPSDRVLESGDTVTMPCRVSARKGVRDRGSVADPHPVDADPDPACHFDGQVDSDPDPDPTFGADAYPVPVPSFQVKTQKMLK